MNVSLPLFLVAVLSFASPFLVWIRKFLPVYIYLFKKSAEKKVLTTGMGSSSIVRSTSLFGVAIIPVQQYVLPLLPSRPILQYRLSMIAPRVRICTLPPAYTWQYMCGTRCIWYTPPCQLYDCTWYRYLAHSRGLGIRHVMYCLPYIARYPTTCYTEQVKPYLVHSCTNTLQSSMGYASEIKKRQESMSCHRLTWLLTVLLLLLYCKKK